MKALTLALAACLATLSAHAKAPSAETASVVQALLDNAELVKKLQDNGSTRISELEIKTLQEGVIEYSVRFHRTCYCRPSNASVMILQDLRPTYADGPIKYTTSITIDEEK